MNISSASRKEGREYVKPLRPEFEILKDLK
jgi:hypothetical protein